LTISTGSLSQIGNIEAINIYPNPNNGTFEIEIENQNLSPEYTIYSYDGRKILNGKMTHQKETIVLPSNIEGGVFSIHIKNEVLRVVIVK
jgi:hypothetical protein